MSGIETVATAIKGRAHSFNYIRKATGLKLSDEQFMDLIQANADRFQFTRIRRNDTNGQRVRPGWPGMKLSEPAPT